MEVEVAVIDANDNNPEFSNYTYEVYISENTPVDSVIIQLRALDPDEGQNGEVVYQFSRHTQDALGHLFVISEQSGEITVKGHIDYEEATEYNLAVVARDRGPSALAAYTKVIVRVSDINDHAPSVRVNTMTGSGQAEIKEGARPGTFVAHISVSDPDGGQNGEFTCLLDNPDFELQKLYETEFKIVSTRVFDREAQAEHSVNIICEDKGQLVQSSTRNIPVLVLDDNDNAPRFERDTFSVHLMENNVLNKVVTQVNATDADTGPNGAITYSVHTVQGFTATEVTVEQSTGLVRARRGFDFEKQQLYQFVVKATDQGQEPLTATATLQVHITDMNDEPPRFVEDAYHFRPLEHQTAGTDVGLVEAHDSDLYPYNIITYSFSATSPDTEMFHIDEHTGLITSTVSLDREDRSQYLLVVSAENEGYDLSSTVVVTVLVSDINDNKPEFIFPSDNNNTAHVSVSTRRGEEVLAVTAVDLDSGQNAALSYQIINQDVSGLFLIDPVHGIMSTNRDLRHYAEQTLAVELRVEDHGRPSLSATAMVNIIVNSTLAEPKSSLLGTNFVIIISLAILALILILLIILVVALLRRRRENRRRAHRYNCRVEATKALVGVKTDKYGGSAASTDSEDAKKREVNLTLNDSGGFEERPGLGWAVTGKHPNGQVRCRCSLP